MGCFSFKCLECGRGVRSSSFTGENVHLFLLKKGEIIQKMTGAYNSYGSVFINGTQDSSVKHKLRLSRPWNDPSPDEPLDAEKVKIIGEEHSIWHRVCDLMHDEEDFTNGIAAIHVKCYKKDPTHRSPNDPDQGWGPKKKPIPNYDPLKELRSNQLREKLWRMKDRMTFQSLMAIDIKTGEVNEAMKKLADDNKRKYNKMKKEYFELGGEPAEWMDLK